MIFCRDKIFAKVWKVTPAEKYLDLQISTSEKDQNGNYINSNWFPRAIGHAFNALKNIKEGDRITITKCKLSNEKYTAKDGTTKSAFRFVILEASAVETRDGDGGTPATAEGGAPDAEGSSCDDNCPW